MADKVYLVLNEVFDDWGDSSNIFGAFADKKAAAEYVSQLRRFGGADKDREDDGKVVEIDLNPLPPAIPEGMHLYWVSFEYPGADAMLSPSPDSNYMNEFTLDYLSPTCGWGEPTDLDRYPIEGAVLAPDEASARAQATELLEKCLKREPWARKYTSWKKAKEANDECAVDP